MEKIRLDALMVEKGYAQSRERAKALIMAGQVYIDNQKCDKAGLAVPCDTELEVRGDTLKYVSRGGLKLEKAMAEFPISLDGKVAMDIGASTGGFTDCMLQNGAKKVYAVDVGYGQLAWKLRNDERVVNLERTNIRYIDREKVTDSIDFASIDVSFISLKLVLPIACELLTDKGEIAALIKPQFEAGRGQVGKKGVVRDVNIHKEVIKNVNEYIKASGMYASGLSFSPVKGPEGNIEYLVWITKDKRDFEITDEIIDEVVTSSHSALDK